MIFFVALIPATMLTVAGYVVLYVSHRSEGGLKSFGRYLSFWAFTLAALVVLGSLVVAAQGERMHGCGGHGFMMHGCGDGAMQGQCPMMHPWHHPPMPGMNPGTRGRCRPPGAAAGACSPEIDGTAAAPEMSGSARVEGTLVLGGYAGGAGDRDRGRAPSPRRLRRARLAGPGRRAGRRRRHHRSVRRARARPPGHRRRGARDPHDRLGRQLAQWRHGADRAQDRCGIAAFTLWPRTRAPALPGLDRFGRARRRDRGAPSASTATSIAPVTWRWPQRQPITRTTAARRSCWRASSATRSASCRARRWARKSAPRLILAASSMRSAAASTRHATLPGSPRRPARRRHAARAQPCRAHRAPGRAVAGAVDGAGTVDAGEVVMATSGYTGDVASAVQRKLLPIGSYVIATEPLPESAGARAQPSRPHDVRLVALPALLPPDTRPAAAVRRPRALRAGEPGHRARERRAIAARHGLDLPATAPTPGSTMPGAARSISPTTRCRTSAWRTAIATRSVMPGMGSRSPSLLGTQVGETLGTAAFQDSPFAQLPFAAVPFGFHRRKQSFLRLAALWYRALDVLT